MNNNFYDNTATYPVAVQALPPHRIFAVHYRGGFAATGDFPTLRWLIENNGKVTVREEPTLEMAYVNACSFYVQESWKENPHKQPVLPKFEDVMKMPYHEPGFIKNVPSQRFFAAINQDYIGIYDTVQGALEFLNYFQPSGMKEFATVDEAKLFLNEKFVLPILSMSAYITDDIPYLKDIDLNTAVKVYYREWWEQHLTMANNLPFEKPKFLHSPEEVK